MEAKDKKYYSNPSHNPDFGKYSPPVPTGLLEKLAAMKIQTPKGHDQQQNNQCSPMQMQYQQITSPVQERILQENCHFATLQLQPLEITVAIVYFL
jgi:hypothetical protein